MLTAKAIEAKNQETMELLGEGDEDKSAAAWENLGLTIIANGVAVIPLIPFRADLKRVFEGVKRDKKAQRRKELQNRGSGTINDSELENDFEFDDFSEEHKEDNTFEDFILEDN